jgi:hypothetical protein
MIPTSNDCHRRPAQQGQVSRSKQQSRRLIDVAQRRRKPFVARQERLGSEPTEPGQSALPVDVLACRTAVAAAVVIPGKERKNANGADKAPSALPQAARSVASRAVPTPGVRARAT